MTKEKITEGAGHIIYRNDKDPGFLLKIPKQLHRSSFSLKRVERDIGDMREIFGKRLPETIVEPDPHTNYRIRQREVEGATAITPMHLEDPRIRQEIEEILEQNRQALLTKECGLDFMGLEGSAKCVLSLMEKARGSFFDTLCIRPGLQAATFMGRHTPLPFPVQSIDWWKKGDTTPAITNLLHGTVDGETSVFVTDVSLVRPKDPDRRERVRSWVLQRWNAYFLKKFFQLKL